MRRTNAAWVLGLGALLVTGVPIAAHAQVYRCTTANGSVAFQDKPCASGQQQKVMDVPGKSPPGYVPPPVATALPEPIASAFPAPVYVPPPAPLPVMYACVGAVNGKHYLARLPPAPYLAPLGVMGYPPQSLSHAYGPHGGAGASAPELSKTRIGGPRIATGMTEVEDYCLPATQAEVCAYVQKQYDENEHALHLAMRSEQPPLARRAHELEDQLRNCR
jgi:hypothetical protein